MFKNRSETLWVFFLIGIYLIASVIWEFASIAPWDDDCVGKYFNAKDAINDPKQFISLWNRPLFVLLFFIPFQLGKHAILFMSIISAFSAYYLFIAAKKLEIKNAVLVLPFLLFQAFFFTISKSALAEPIASAILCFGIYFYVHKKYLAFALLGALLPLARLELALFLGVWAFLLIREKQFKLLVLLAVPTILWSLAGTLFTGETFWLYEQTVGKENGSNRYGHTSFWHYFLRYIYVLGPVVFYFFFIGFFENLFKKKSRLLVTGQFVLGFALYVVFSWKLNLGQAAGFLRHLITLSPLAAILAVEGFNYWLQFIKKGKPEKAEDQKLILEKKLEERELQINSEIELIKASVTKKAKAIKFEVNRKKKEFEDWKIIQIQNLNVKKKSTNFFVENRIVIYTIGLLVLTYFAFSRELLSHHKLTEVANYSNLILIASVAVLLVVLKILYQKDVLGKSLQLVSWVLVSGMVMSYTLITELPDSHNSPEREAMTKVAQVYAKSEFADYKTYVNHSWFFWANNFDRDKNRYNEITQKNLENAPDSSIIIWENHYSRRLAGDVELDYFKGKGEYVELFREMSADRKFLAVVFLKNKKVKKEELTDYYNHLTTFEEQFSSLYVNRGHHRLNRLKDKKMALADYEKSMAIDSLNADGFYFAGVIYYQKNLFQKALDCFVIVNKLNGKYQPAFFNAGICAVKLGQDELALKKYNRLIALNPKRSDGRYNRGVLRLRMNKPKAACIDLKLALEYGEKRAKPVLEKYCKD